MSEVDHRSGFLSARAYEQLKISSAPRLIQVAGGPFVVPTRRGYQPVLVVEELHEGKHYLLYISAVSLTEGLEALRASNSGELLGVAMAIRKVGDGAMAPYDVQRA
jgi:hypothetical protein